MKKDIDIPKVEGVEVAIARKKNEADEYDWHVYLINRNNFGLENILITSTGYGEKDGEKQKTSTLRQMIEKVAEESFAVIERIDPQVFHLSNEYWISYYVDGKIHDKKFIFMPGSIVEQNLSNIDVLELEGVRHI
jgi:DNA polymerase III alpha subunit